MSDINTISPEVMLVQMIVKVIVKSDETLSYPDLAPAERKQLERLRNVLDAYRIIIIRNLINANTKAFKGHITSLQKVNEELQKTIDDVTNLADTLKNLVKFVEVVGEITTLVSRAVGLAVIPEVPLVRSAAVSSFAPVEKKASLKSANKISRGLDPSLFEEPVKTPPPEREMTDTPPEAAPVKQVPVEEVLHGIELTPESLIITVATGGCTKRNSFRVDVVIGTTGAPPYLVIIYRIKSDDCKGDFEPIRISFSLKELGLEGAVDFRVLNRIGNTSQHRLLP